MNGLSTRREKSEKRNHRGQSIVSATRYSVTVVSSPNCEPILPDRRLGWIVGARESQGRESQESRGTRIPGTDNLSTRESQGQRIPGTDNLSEKLQKESHERIPGTDNLSKKLHENPRDDENPRDRQSIKDENPRDRQSIKEVTRPGRKGFQINAGDSQDLLWKRPSIRQLVCPRGDVPRNASGDFGFGKSAYLGSAWNSGGTIFFTVSMIRSSISGASCAGRP